MTSVGKTAAVIVFLAAVAVATPFAPGTRFGMVGLDYRISGGRIYSYPHDSDFSSVDPVFRVGLCVTRNLALGADLALLRTFPRHDDMFLNTPVFAFGPVATWIPAHSGRVQAYGTVGANVVYDFVRRQGWRGRAGAGALFDVGIPVTFGPEVGCYADFVHVATSHVSVWDSGFTFFIGLRLSDLRL
jgi:hypothetical protein